MYHTAYSQRHGTHKPMPLRTRGNPHNQRRHGDRADLLPARAQGGADTDRTYSPGMSKGTPPRAIRISTDLWEQVKDAAKAYGTDASSIVRIALEQFLADPLAPNSNPLDRPERHHR